MYMEPKYTDKTKAMITPPVMAFFFLNFARTIFVYSCSDILLAKGSALGFSAEATFSVEALALVTLGVLLAALGFFPFALKP